MRMGERLRLAPAFRLWRNERWRDRLRVTWADCKAIWTSRNPPCTSPKGASGFKECLKGHQSKSYLKIIRTTTKKWREKNQKLNLRCWEWPFGVWHAARHLSHVESDSPLLLSYPRQLCSFSVGIERTIFNMLLLQKATGVLRLNNYVKREIYVHLRCWRRVWSRGIWHSHGCRGQWCTGASPCDTPPCSWAVDNSCLINAPSIFFFIKSNGNDAAHLPHWPRCDPGQQSHTLECLSRWSSCWTLSWHLFCIWAA